MKAIPQSIILFRLIGMLVACWAVPALLCHYMGPAVGSLGAAGAAAFWYSRYRFPSRKQGCGPQFWFVAIGYMFIGVTLAVCLGRLLGVN